MQAPKIVQVLLPFHFEAPLTYALPLGVEAGVGAWVRVPLQNREVDGVVWAELPPASHSVKFVKEVFGIEPLSPSLMKFIEWVAGYTLSPLGLVLKLALYDVDELLKETARLGVVYKGGVLEKETPARRKLFAVMKDGLMRGKTEAAREAGVTPNVVNTLVDEGLLEVSPIPPEMPEKLDVAYAPPRLSEEQAEALELLNDVSINASVTLLEGVTGSGKTEVYTERITQALEKGEQVLLLMPEIALTPSFTARLTKRYGGEPVLWHSGLSPSRRKKNYKFIQNGDAKLVIGARSALFLPFKNLKLVVIDEEHEPSYKQEEGVRYHARDMAIVRGKLENFPVVLASATPSIETRVNANSGKYHHIRLDNRFGAGELPHIHLIDLKKQELAKDTWIAPIVVEAMRAALEDKKQVLLFLNRRGYAPLTLCKGCGEKFSCPSCTSFLTDHRFKNRLTCHHCGFSMERPKTCLKCESTEFAAIGPGVERLAEEAVKLFPTHRTLILSSDMAGGITQLKQEIEAIERREIDIIVGTQLVAKGHHFGGIALVGVIDADLALGQTDPRAAERTFQVLSQVTGRAGREGAGSQAYLQTYLPDHAVMQAIKRNEKEKFYREEIAIRERGNLPPFGRMAAIIISSDDANEAMRYARDLVKVAPLLLQGKILGPVEAPLHMLKDRFRVRLLVKTKRDFAVSSLMREWLAGSEPLKGSLKCEIDIDPLSFM